MYHFNKPGKDRGKTTGIEGVGANKLCPELPRLYSRIIAYLSGFRFTHSFKFSPENGLGLGCIFNGYKEVVTVVATNCAQWYAGLGQ